MRYLKLQAVIDLELEREAFDYQEVIKQFDAALKRGIRTMPPEYHDSNFTMSVSIESEIQRTGVDKGRRLQLDKE